MENANQLIGCCGLDCEKCDARIATLTNDNALREKTAALWTKLNGVTILPEMINCTGCRIEGAKTPFCDRLCPVHNCVREKKLATFTRAFYREFGLNPSEYMKKTVPVPFFIPYGAKYRELRKENIDMSNIQPIFIQAVCKPERLCIIKRGKQAEDYFPYCEEVSCDVWGILMSMKSLCGEPVSMWLSEKYKKPNTSTYVQGVEVETDYMGMIPEGFDTIHLPEAEYLMFQGQPFREEDYCEAIRTVQAAMDSYDPSVIGCCWDDENPRIQLEPRGQRGYIELRAVRRIQK